MTRKFDNAGDIEVTASGHVNIAANRAARKWSRKQMLGRAFWETIGAPLFAWSPRALWGWRRFVLQRFGAEIGRDVHIHPAARIAVPWNLAIGDEAAVGDGAIIYNLGMITIGPRATISQHAHLCAGSHDHRKVGFDLIKPPINIGEEAWICADAFIGPSVTVGRLAIVGARAVAMRDVAEKAIVVGNPARVVGRRSVLER